MKRNVCRPGAVVCVLLLICSMFGAVSAASGDFTLPSEKTVAIGEINVIEPEFIGEEPKEYIMKWSSSDESVATVTQEGKAGIITAKAKGQAIICATMKIGSQTVTRETTLHVSSKARDTVLVLDLSGSMDGRPMEEMKEAALMFCRQILQDGSANRLGLVCFNDYVTSYPMTENIGEIEQVIQGIEYCYGTTNMEGALREAGEMLDSQGRPEAIRNVVIMADGLPNEGLTSGSGSFAPDAVYMNAVVDTAQKLKKNYRVYAMGFFHSLFMEELPEATRLMREIATSDEDFYTITEAENLQFAFEDIADDISTGAKIVVNIACPVDVTITYGNESLSSAEDISVTSFGSLQRLGKDGDIKVAVLDADKVYDVRLSATDDGSMDYSVVYYDENEQITDSRSFPNVPLSKSTEIWTNTDNTVDIALHIDADGDGQEDSVWVAGKNGIGAKEKEQSPWIIVLCIVAAVVVIGGVIVILGTRKGRVSKHTTIPEPQVVKPFDGPSETPRMAEAPTEPVRGCIRFLNGELSDCSVTICNGETFAVGKDPALAQIVIPRSYTYVSRMHCIISFAENQYYVIDCSRNGTCRRNHAKLEKGARIPISRNTVLMLGNEECLLRLE